jgi:hypothetical protein
MSRRVKIIVLVTPILCVVVAFGVRAIVQGRSGTAEEAPRNNLRQIDDAKRQWDATNNMGSGTNKLGSP